MTHLKDRVPSRGTWTSSSSGPALGAQHRKDMGLLEAVQRRDTKVIRGCPERHRLPREVEDGCPISGNSQGQAEQGSEQPDLLKLSLLIAGGLGYVAFKGHF